MARMRTRFINAALMSAWTLAAACGEPTTPPFVDDAPPRGTVEVIAGSTSRGVADGVGEQARFQGPAAITAGDTSIGVRAVLADTFAPSLRAVDMETREVTTLSRAPSVGEPRGLTTDGAAVLYADGPCVRRLDRDASITTLAGDCATSDYVDGTGGAARFSFLLHDLELDRARNELYLSDRLNDAIRVLDLDSLEVTTLAGGTGAGFDDGVGSAAHFDGPGGLALDTTTDPPRLFVADTFNSAVRVIDTQTGDTTTLASIPEPQGLALIDTGDGARALVLGGFDGVARALPLTPEGAGEPLTLVDGLGGTFASPTELPGEAAVLWMDLDGPLLRIDASAPLMNDPARASLVAGPRDPIGYVDGDGANARFGFPAAVQVADGTAYIADYANHAIRSVDLESYRVRTLVGGAEGDSDGDFGDARLSLPGGLALDADARVLYVADSGNQKIRALDLDNESVRTLAGNGTLGGDDGAADGASFADPWGLALHDGALFVADSSGPTVRRIALDDGTVATVAGTFGAVGFQNGVGAAARFRLPTGLAAADGALWLADAESHTLRRIDPITGETTTALGTDSFPGVSDGPSATALLSTPLGVRASADGSLLFVAEAGSSLVRRVKLESLDSLFIVGRMDLAGGLGTQVPTPIEDATLLEPQDVAAAGDDLVIVSDGAVWLARP
jgi:DNA-binding beta-propeller fold protein YncE